MKTTDQSRIFLSYSHRGSGPAWKAKLLKALEVFERHHLLDVWEDGKIRVSAAWNDDITQAMASANLAVFLLTPEVLESEFILKTELPFLKGRWERERIPVFPVVCEPCRWKEVEESKWLHAIQSPAGAEPLSSFPEAVADRHLRESNSISSRIAAVTAASSDLTEFGGEETDSFARLQGLASHGESLESWVEACRRMEGMIRRNPCLLTETGQNLGKAYNNLIIARAALYRSVISRRGLREPPTIATSVGGCLGGALDGLRKSEDASYLPDGLLTSALMLATRGDISEARDPLDEAWDIAERGPMRLHLADIHLYRARLFFRETPYPWQSPQADLAAAEKLINECGYHRRDEELKDAKRAILGGVW